LKAELQHHAEKLCQIASLFSQFNFDMLKAVVEEMNRYNEGPEDALRMLNVKPEFDAGNKFTVKLQLNGDELKDTDLESQEWSGNPLQSHVQIHYKSFDDKPDEDGDLDWDWERLRFEAVDLKKIDSQTGKFVFVKDGAVLTLNRVKEKSFSYYDAF
jgi:hypothetical protein